MIKISDNSENCGKSELSLFNLPYTQTQVEKYSKSLVEAESGWDTNKFIRFPIESKSNQFIDLAETELFIELGIKGNVNDTTYSPPTFDNNNSKDPVFPINNILHSFFRSLEVKFNGTSVEKVDNYPYKAYLLDLLNNDTENKDSIMIRQGFIKDTPNKFNNFNLEEKNYIDIAKLYDQQGALLKTGNLDISEKNDYNSGANKIVTFRGKLHLDTFNLDRYLIPGVKVELKLNKTEDTFFLMCNSTNDKISTSVQLMSIYLYVKYVDIYDSHQYSLLQILSKEDALYPIKRVDLDVIALDMSHDHATFDIGTGIIPNRVAIGFVKSTAYNGAFKENPFEFQDVGLKEIDFLVSGLSMPYYGGLDYDPDNKYSYMKAYNTLFTECRESSCGITLDDFIGVNFLHVSN